MSKVTKLFTDGGTLGANPSRLGGSWCYVWVDEHDKILRHRAGTISPKTIGLSKVSNNVAELYAAVQGLKSVGDGWNGILYTDSSVTLYRLTDSKSFNGIPQWLKQETEAVRKHGKYQVVLLAGHPTRKQMLTGVNDKGRPVSRFNDYADKACQEVANEFMQRREKH